MIEGMNLGVFLASALALNLTPGPDMLFVLGNGVRSGKDAAFVSALGLTGGYLVHIVAAAFGLTLILSSSATAFAAVKAIGAAYLLYLGIKNVLFTPHLEDEGKVNAKPERSSWSTLRQGALVSTLNPKVALFFLAFLPQFVPAHAEHMAAKLGFLGFLFAITSTLVHCLVAAASGQIASAMRRNPRLSQKMDRGSGVIFVGLAVRLLMMRNAPAS